MSLDSIRRERFTKITGKNLLPEVMAGIDEALDAGFVPLKLNTVVMAGVVQVERRGARGASRPSLFAVAVLRLARTGAAKRRTAAPSATASMPRGAGSSSRPARHSSGAVRDGPLIALSSGAL
ncbi:MAG: hypothetical protein HY675_29420 [Chloroflexi bacterium]|nr:hypothetical protein [Chloroflexota bacterium]